MNYKTLGLVCAFLLCPWGAGAYNYFAPNSFETVKEEAWSYQAVRQLCEEGAAPGYDGNTFEQGAMTRYELARIVEAVIQSPKKKSPEHRAMLEKLRKEYARELDSFSSGEKEKSVSPREAKVEVRDVDGNRDSRMHTTWHIGNKTV